MYIGEAEEHTDGEVGSESRQRMRGTSDFRLILRWGCDKASVGEDINGECEETLVFNVVFKKLVKRRRKQ